MAFSFSSDCGPLLFSWWHPRSYGSYCISLVVIFFLGMNAELLGTRARAASQKRSRGSAEELTRAFDTSDDDAPQQRVVHSRSPSSRLREGALHTLSIALHMAIMLLVMSFNAGIFSAVVLGMAVARTLSL